MIIINEGRLTGETIMAIGKDYGYKRDYEEETREQYIDRILKGLGVSADSLSLKIYECIKKEVLV